MKINKFVNYIFLFTVMSIFTFGGVIALMQRKDINVYENRPTNKIVPFKIEEFLNGDYQASIEDMLADQLPLSITIKRQYNTTINTVIDKLNHQVFYEPYKVYPYHGLLKFEDSVLYHQRLLKDEREKLDLRIDNISTFIERNPELKTYVYYIEKDTDINFETNEKSNVSTYLKENLKLDEKNISMFSIDNYDMYAQYFYKTDHHWNNVGSYKGYKDIISMILVDEPVLEPIGEKCFKDVFSGSKAARTGTKDINRETMCIYDFNLGPHETIVDGEVRNYTNYIDESSNPDSLTYAQAFGSDNSVVTFDYANDKDNILIFGESFDNAIIELISSHFNTTHAIDLRNYKDKGLDVAKYIRENDIDTVLFVGNIDFFVSENFNLEVE